MCADPGARSVQGGAVHGRGNRRPPGTHPRHTRIAAVRAGLDDHQGRRPRQRSIDGGDSADGRVHRQRAGIRSVGNGTAGDRLVLAGIFVGSMLTVAYSLRFCTALLRPNMVRPNMVSSDAAARPVLDNRPVLENPPAPGFVAPAALLAVATVALGVAPMLWSGLVDHAAQALDPRSTAQLSLWHGFTPALALSLCTLGAGIGLFLARRPIGAAQARLAPPVSGAAVYEAIVREVLRFAGRLTGIVQSGSLPVYGAVILGTAAVARPWRCSAVFGGRDGRTWSVDPARSRSRSC